MSSRLTEVDVPSILTGGGREGPNHESSPLEQDLGDHVAEDRGVPVKAVPLGELSPFFYPDWVPSDGPIVYRDCVWWGFAILRGVVSVVSGDPAGAVSNLTESCLSADDVTWPEGAGRR